MILIVSSVLEFVSLFLVNNSIASEAAFSVSESMSKFSEVFGISTESIVLNS